jgi:hypothetical protein
MYLSGNTTSTPATTYHVVQPFCHLQIWLPHAGLSAAPPSTPYLCRRRRQRSPGEARATPAAALHYLRHGERVGAFPAPGGGATRAAAVRQGRVAVARWHRVEERQDGGGPGNSLPKIWATWAQEGLGRAPDGLGQAGVAQFVVLRRGGDDDSTWLGRRQGRHVAAGLPVLYGPV